MQLTAAALSVLFQSSYSSTRAFSFLPTRIARLENNGLRFLLPLPDYGAKLLSDVLQSQLTGLCDHHQAALSVALSYEDWLAVGEEDRVGEQDLAALDLLVGRQQVLNQTDEGKPLARQQGQVLRGLHLQALALSYLLTTHLAVARKVGVSFALLCVSLLHGFKLLLGHPVVPILVLGALLLLACSASGSQVASEVTTRSACSVASAAASALGCALAAVVLLQRTALFFIKLLDSSGETVRLS